MRLRCRLFLVRFVSANICYQPPPPCLKIEIRSSLTRIGRLCLFPSQSHRNCSVNFFSRDGTVFERLQGLHSRHSRFRAVSDQKALKDTDGIERADVRKFPRKLERVERFVSRFGHVFGVFLKHYVSPGRESASTRMATRWSLRFRRIPTSS